MIPKSVARTKIITHRRSLPLTEFSRYDARASTYADEILQLLMHHFPHTTSSKEPFTVAGFLPQTTEPGSRTLFHALINRGIDIYCPIVEETSSSATQSMQWAVYRGTETLGKWDIPIPYPTILKRDIMFHAMFIPALMIDTAGNRLGRGGGFYDRFLANYSAKTLRIGMVFSWEHIPVNNALAWENDPWDTAMHYILTEKSLSSLPPALREL